ncbi:hypothetical protein [uncultured Aquimarina sp.]|uniref:hypothetical protein n=1 Tax=uncultured Aquimarina sp. TaxID=575652 RepID=UPI00260CDF96|nr:hypothetical protein [uncultured Aquimarina sp.]
MRDLNSMKNQSEKVTIISLNNNEKVTSPTTFSLITIIALFFTFITLSAGNNNIFLTEILLSGVIICLLSLQNFASKTKR